MKQEERDEILAFIHDKHWSLIEKELDTLVNDYLGQAARAEIEKHQIAKGRLEGAERAKTVIFNLLTKLRKDTSEDGRRK